MTFDLLATGTTAVSIEFGPEVSWLLAFIAVLLAVLAWFVRREITQNSLAHSRLEDSIARLGTELSGRIAALSVRVDARADALSKRLDDLYGVLVQRD